MTRRPLPALCSLVAALALAPAASAQQIELDGFTDGPTIEERSRPAPAGPEAGSGDPAPEPETLVLPLRPPRLAASDPETYRMSGQYDQASFTLFVPVEMSGAELRIATQSAIDILPQRSAIEVSVNGTPVGTLTPDNFGVAGIDTFSVPDGLLTAGRNRVTLSARQVHRVFCGPDAAFNLWTDIALPESGIEMPLADLPVGPLGFLAGASAQIARDIPLQLRMPDPDATMAEASDLIARFDAVYGQVPPEISVGNYYSASENATQRARITVLTADYALPNGPEFRRGGDGAIVFLLRSGDYDNAAQVFTGAVPAPSSEFTTPIIEPGRPTTLAELDTDGIEGRGRYIREHVQFRLPSDWLLLASQTGELRLDWRYDTDLPKGGLLLVKVNGTTIQLLPLDEPENAGRPLPTLRIPFAANLLRPGANRLTFEALVPGDPPDEACVPSEAPIFEISGGTSLTIPPSPRLSLPGIERTLQFAPRSAISLSEAAEVTLSPGLLPRLSSVLAAPTGQDTDLDSDIEIKIGIPADIAALDGDVVADHAEQLRAVMQSERQERGSAEDAWSQVGGNQWWRGLLQRDRITQFPARLNEWLRAIWTGNESALAPWLAERSADAILLQPDMEQPGHLWLLLEPDGDHRAVIASLAESRDAYRGPHGQVSVFLPDTGWESWDAPNRPLLLREPLTAANARTVVGNYVTIIPGRYIGPILILAVLSSIVAFGIAVVTRRKRA
ncbi:hypothetical protein OCH239_05495 [Roseivivax halodurans JCM 10272]|uniref:Cyclic di-GMP-binding protein n=1 Tax=Roseivivax halodurans JCM 10272 TaxID=1449350 RepID=X7EFT8_9RHOB|nr:cellulose biosynthesis cyclic di-GMP-binding regulatory protein BcsB [Roseivivax halodurans]ETX14096.1 hypothetical protein OCH239_05495 [Roseivivax halodurans JCM 10272]